MLYYIGLEDIDMRYTKHLNRDVIKYLKQNNIKFENIVPKNLPECKIEQGSFLDAAFTTMYKSEQLKQIAQLYKDKKIEDNDIFFFADLWFPGIESIRYMDYFCNKKVKIKGLFHAGSFTDTDFVRQLERWAKGFEDIICDITDEIFVGSKFMKQDMIQKRFVSADKITITGFPLDFIEFEKYKEKYKGEKKKDIVIFNGRNVDEKQPWLFKELKKRINNPNIEFINTHSLSLAKNDYYDLLAQAKCVVSYALQENFGFGILEAVYLGCVPVVPNRLVYPEHFIKEFLYDNFEESVLKVQKAISGEVKAPLVNNFGESLGKWFK